MAPPTTHDAAELEQLKKKRGVAKAALIKINNNLSTAIQEQDNELNAALVEFNDVYTAYHQLLDENNIDDSKAYYELVLRDVQKLKHQAGQLLDNVPVHVNEPPARAEPQTKPGNQTEIQHQAQAEGQITSETEDIAQTFSQTQVDEINKLKAEIKE